MSQQETESPKPQNRRAVLAAGVGAALTTAMGGSTALADDAPAPPKIKQLNPIQFIAALDDPQASSGVGADKWGLWVDDPGPQGVFLRDYEKQIQKRNNIAPVGWKFDPSAWWVEEHGIIMPTPGKLPLTGANPDMKRYLVTGGRDTKSLLTVHKDGRWELSKGRLYDVTHLPCRSAIYTGAEGGQCVPNKLQQIKFPVKPGAKMPEFPGCKTEDWSVLFVLGEEVA
jgi:hypothetical protein